MPSRLSRALTCVAFGAALGLGSLAAPAAGQDAAACDPAPAPLPGEVVIGYTTPQVPAAVRAAVGPLVEIDDRPPYYARVGVAPGDAVANVLRGLREVRFVEANSRLCVSAVPNDPLLRDQWPAGDGAGAPGLRSAWDVATAAGAIVAVIDTGIDLAHPDLVPNLWVNAGEVPGNGADDDRNGIVDDARGANLIARRGEGVDDHGHGTFVAGIVGARGDNGIGVAGVAWQAQLMAVKTMDATGLGVSTDTADGIRYAVDRGARILNLSVNGDQPDTVQREAIEYAGRAGAVVVASAGNAGRDIDAAASYPPSWGLANVIGVAAARQDGALAPYSNRGPRSVEFAAPGDSVMSTNRGGGYGRGSGTSYAAPHVSGALALLAGVRPDLDGVGLAGLLTQTARPVAGLGVGAGRLDAGAALQQQRPTPASTAPAGGGGGTGGSGTGPGPGAGPGGSGGPSVSGGAGFAIRLAAGSRRVRAGRRPLRWEIRGDVARITGFRVLVDRRTAARGRVRATRAPLRLTAPVRLRAGRRQVRLVLLDAAGATIGGANASVRVRR